MDRAEGIGPSVTAVLVTDNLQGEERWRRAAESLGVRALGSARTASANDALAAPVRFDVALVDVEEDSGGVLDRLVDELDRAAGEARYRSIVALPLELVDPVAAQIGHRDVELLCAPSEADRIAALAIAAAPRAARLHDRSRDREEGRLLRLSEETARIARALADLSQAVPGGLARAPIGHSEAPPGEMQPTPEGVRTILRARRLRGRFLDEALFADPAWDMLLDLLEARLRGREVAVSSLCIAAAVPPTTALRWIKTLTERGLFVRRADPDDGRRVFIELSDEAAQAMEAWFAAAAKGNGLPPA